MSGTYGPWMGAYFILLMMMALGTGHPYNAAGEGPTAIDLEGPDTNQKNNDDFSTAQELASGDYLDGATGLGDTHRIDTFLLGNIPAGKVVNASCRIYNFNGQALMLTGWNRHHSDTLAWSNREDNPERREWEALSFLCVVTGDYYIQVKPISGTGTIEYRLNIQAFDPEDITDRIGSGGECGETITGSISSYKWYPGHWYKLQMSGEQNGQNDYLYVNMTLPGGPEERLQGDLYARNLESDSWSYWLNQSWWLCSRVQHEELHVAACRPGPSWYYLDVQAYNTSGGRSESYELRLSKTLIDSDGDNHPLNATKVTYEQGKTTVRRTGSVVRGPDMFDWYKVYQKKGGGLSANLTLQEKSAGIFRLSIYRDNLTNHGYDLMSSWTNKPADTVLNRVNALAANVTQEGWYYVGVIAQIGLIPNNLSNLADWTVQTAWAEYTIDLTLGCSTSHWPHVKNPPPDILMSEDGEYSGLKLNLTGNNSGVFTDEDLGEEWGDALYFNCVNDPNFTVIIDEGDPEAPVNIRPNRDWNGEANLTFVATDLFGKSISTVVHVRVSPSEDPPLIKTRIPDFVAPEGSANLSMKDIDLFQVFSDPDMPPLGKDSMTFSVDNITFPAWINGSVLDFGPAPFYAGHEDHRLTVNVTARDAEGAYARCHVNITILDVNRLPEWIWCCGPWIYEDEVSYLDLNGMFSDPDGDALTVVYEGGASDNLTVTMTDNKRVMFVPAKDYHTAWEVLSFRAFDALGGNSTGQMLLGIGNVNDPPILLPGGAVPDPLEVVRINEGESLAFRVSPVDVDNKTTELRYTWSVDGVEGTRVGGPAFIWRPGYEDAGAHRVAVRISDGLADMDVEWTATVLETNRPPAILECWPLNNTEGEEGEKIEFRVCATDPDGGSMTFAWRFADGTLLRVDTGKNDSAFSKKLSAGLHIVVLDVTDENGGITRQYIYLNVSPPPSSYDLQPWIYIGLCAVVLTAAFAAINIYMRRK